MTEERRTFEGLGTYTTRYTHDAMDRVTTLTYPDGEVVAQTYNVAGQPATLTGADAYVKGTTYNALGQLEALDLGNDLTTHYDYFDAAGNHRLERIRVQEDGGATHFDLAYGYDDVGNVTSIADAQAPTSDGTQTLTFTYDALDRLIEANATGAEAAGGYSHTYDYDALGNLLARDGEVYAYNGNGYAHAQPHAVTAAGADTFTYDANGNMTRRVEDGVTYHQAFDVENRLVAVTRTTGLTETVTRFAYDGDGARVAQVTDLGTTLYVGNVYETFFLGESWAPVTTLGEPQNPPLPASSNAPTLTERAGRPDLKILDTAGIMQTDLLTESGTVNRPVLLHDGTVEVQNEAYRARWNANGLFFTLADVPKNISQDSITVQLKGMQSKEHSEFQRAPSVSPTLDKAGHVEYTRPGIIEETHIAMGKGVEQLLILQERPEQKGTLDIIVQLSAPGLTLKQASGAEVWAVDETQEPIFRYSVPLVYDAYGRTYLPELQLHGEEVHILISANWLATAAYPVFVDPFLTGDLAIEVTGEQQQRPKVAYNGRDNEYLVVWRDLRREGYPGRWDIYGKIINADGISVTTASVIAQEESHETRPEVIFNSVTEEYLAVWTRTESPHGVYARRVLRDGSLASPVISVSVTDPYTADAEVAVAVNSQTGEYLVAWSQTENGTDYNSYVRRLSSDGLPDTDPVTLATGSMSSTYPGVSLAYNSAQNEYLAVWQSKPSSHHNVYGQRIGTDGQQIGPNISIGTGAGPQWSPAVAYNDREDEYLAVWSDGAPSLGYMNLQGRRLSTTGQLLGDIIPVSQSPAHLHWYPNLAYHHAGNEYLVIWERGEGKRISHNKTYDIYGARVGASGELLPEDDPDTFCIPQGASEAGQFSTGLAYNHQRSEFLIVWDDYRDEATNAADIYGRLYAPPDETPPEDWRDFQPTGWQTTSEVRSSVKVTDYYTGLASGADATQVRYAYDGGTWTTWHAASCEGCGAGPNNTGTLEASTTFADSTNHLVQFRACDLSHNCSESPQYTVQVDTTPPVVTHGSDGVWNPGANPSATDGTSGIQTRTFSVDGQAKTWQSHENLCSNLDLADGVHTVSVHATDYAGHENAGNTSFKCDLTPPSVTTVTVTPPAFSPLLSQTTRVETEISDSYPATWTLTITNAHDALVREAGGAYSPNYHLTWTWDGRDANGNIVADGTYTITVSATDQVGHRTDETITVAVDTTPPSLVVSRPEDMLHTGGRALYVEAFSDPGATFRILVNGQWLRDWTFSNTGVITDIISTRRWLSAGENELCFKVWDDLGNSQEETRLVTYENGEPTISNPLPAPRSILTQTRPTLSASFTMSGTGEIYTPTALVKLDGTDVTTQSIITSAGFVYTPTVSLDEGFHGVHVQVQSTVSRTGSANWSFDIDRSTWLNVTAPLSGTRLNALTTTVRGEGEPGADVTVTVNDAPAGTGTVDTWGSVQIDHVTLTTGTQTLQVDIVDSVGNRQVETLSVTVDPYRPGVSADAQPPAFSPGRCLPQTTFVLEAHPPSGEAIAAWRLDVLSGTTVVTSVNGINLPPSTVTWDGRGDDGTLLPEGTYRYTLAVTATNGMTNTTVPQPVYIDLTPPAAPEIETPHNNTEVDEWRIWVSGVADPGSTITLLDGGYFTHTLTTTVGLDGRWSAYYPLHGGINDVYAIATDASCEASEPSDTHHIMLWANPPLHTVGISPTLVSAGNTVILWATARHDNPYEGAPTIGVWTQLPRAGSVPLTRTHTLQEGARGWWEVDDTVKPSLPSGDYAVFYEGVDEDGQLGDGETALVVRNQPPTPRITAPRSPRYTAESQVILDGEVDASELTVQVADGENILDEQAIGLQMYWHMEVQVPGEGPHPLRARAEDRFGQYSEWSEAVTMTLDTTPPVVTMTASSPYTHAWFFPVGWPATDPPAGSAPGAGVSSYDVQWRFDPPPGSSTEETGWTKVWSFPIYRTQTSYWPEMGEGIYWFRARARDILNNQSTYTATTPVSVTVDRTDPHIRLTVTEATPYAIVDGTMIIYGAHESSFTVTATLSDALAGLHKVTFTETVSSGATYHQADGVQETAVSHIYTFDAADTFSGRGTVVVNDRAANTREAHFRMQQDATPPTVHLTAAPAATTSASAGRAPIAYRAWTMGRAQSTCAPTAEPGSPTRSPARAPGTTANRGTATSSASRPTTTSAMRQAP